MSTPSPVPLTAPESSRAPAGDNIRGIAWILASVLGASAMSVAVRELSGSIDSRVIVALRAGILTCAILPLLAMPRFRRQMRFSQPGLHVLRGALIGLSTHLGFYTLSQIPLATASVLFFTAPIFATILAAIYHGEAVGLRRWSAVSAGFLGAAIILRPGIGELHPAMLAALGSSALFAVALTLSRRLADADGPTAAYVSSVVITLLVSLPIAAPVWAVPQTGYAWIIMGVVVLGGLLRGFADIEAYRWGEASVLAPITYLRLVLVGGAGYVLFDEVPDGWTLIGATIIVAATLYIARREAVIRRRARGVAP